MICWIKEECAAFFRAASRYDFVAALQREIGQRMLERLNLVSLKPGTVVDLGAGTGVATVALEKRYPGARVALDFAFSDATGDPPA